MSDSRWRRIEELFTEALDLSATERAAFLETVCDEDESLRSELESLLCAAGEAEDYFDTLSRKAGIPQPDSSPVLDFDGKSIGAYRLVRLLGRGGMGAVFLAERDDGQFEKRVAVKLLPLGMATAEAERRFFAERRLLAALEHPNIARLLDGGITEDGTPYFVMELVEGLRIDEHCSGQKCSVEECLELFLQVLDAVEYAHRHSVVHRDLKPANILVSDEGRVKLLDFGVAKLLDTADGGSPTTLTRLGGRPLTPRYASPEQLDGEPVSPATDVYALGVLLYELLTGTPPYELEGLSTEQMRQIVLQLDPEPPSHRMLKNATNGSAPRLSRRRAGDLDNIVFTALRKKPQHRYPTAAALRDDIQRHLEARPIRARGASRTRRTRRFLMRHRLAGSVSAAAGLIALALAAWPSKPPVPILAVGAIENRTGSDFPGAEGLSDLLAADLAALSGLQVVSSERMHEVRAQLGIASPSGVQAVAGGGGS